MFYLFKTCDLLSRFYSNLFKINLIFLIFLFIRVHLVSIEVDIFCMNFYKIFYFFPLK